MSVSELNDLFAAPPDKHLPEDVLGELRSIMRIHSVSEQELFFKWEAYSIKMGTDGHSMSYQTVRDFKKDLADVLERESRGRAQHTQSASKRSHAGTPRASGGADLLNGLISGTPSGPRSIAKRKANNMETPTGKSSRTAGRDSPMSTPIATGDNTRATAFHDRPNPGQIIESLNAHVIADSSSSASTAPSEARVKLKANTELVKFNYRPMAMKLSEASEILDDRLDEFAQLVQLHHDLGDAAFGNPAAQSTAEIIAVGRIASDNTQGGKLNAASLVLETSRRMGAGLRIPLRMADGLRYDVFPGKIVAVRGTNPAGEYFSVTEFLSLPLLHLPASTPSELETHNTRLSDATKPLHVIVGSGPYTQDKDLNFDALHALLDKAAETQTDVLILSGPFLDVQHPLVASGDFELPADYHVSPDRATLTDAFGAFISRPLSKLIEKVPTITIILVPSVRDASSKHVAWPQDRFPKRDLGLPKQVFCVTNPITLSINELVVGISSQDVLYEMQRQTVAQLGETKASDDVMARLSSSLIQQRHFFPVFPPLAPDALPRPSTVYADGVPERMTEPTAVGACLDIPYLKLGDWLQVRPDLLITPSMLTPFAKVVDSVVVVNPGQLSKSRAPGTFAQLKIVPRTLREGEGATEKDLVGHELYDRARVDIVRI